MPPAPLLPTLRRCAGLRSVVSAVSLVAMCLLPARAQSPAWWESRGVLSGQPADDYAAANLGQLKHVASKAAAELNSHLPGGAGADINKLIASWTAAPAAGITRDDFAAVNLGQLKTVARLFYDRLIAVHYLDAYPWANDQPDDYALTNLGQLKYLFSFNLTLDSDGDGLPDWWELAAGLDPNDPGDASSLTGNPTNVSGTGQHLSNTAAYQAGFHPASTRDPLKPETGKGKPLLELSTTTYAAIDVSSQATNKNIGFVAIDDQNNVAIGFTSDDYKSLTTAVAGNGIVGQKKSFPYTESRPLSYRWEPMPGSIWRSTYGYSVDRHFSGMAANGELAGINYYHTNDTGFFRAFRYNGIAETEYWPDMDESDPEFHELGAFAFSGAPYNGDLASLAYRAINLGAAGLLAGPDFLAQGSTSIWYGFYHTSAHTSIAHYLPDTFSPSGVSAGYYGAGSSGLFEPSGFAVGIGTELIGIGHLLPLAVSDNGTVLGADADATDSHNSLSIRVAGFTELLSHKLPGKYHGKIRFPGDNLGARINNQSDIIVNAELLDDTDPSNPIWVSRQLLWRNALGLETNPSTLSFVEFPNNAIPQQFNNRGNFSAFISVAVTDAENHPVNDAFGNAITRPAAGLLLPVEFKARDQFSEGFDPPIAGDVDPLTGLKDEDDWVPWTSVSKAGGSSVNNWVKVTVPDAASAALFELHVASGSTDLISVSPTELSGAETNIQITGKTGDDEIRTAIVELRVKGSAQVIGRLKVMVLPPRGPIDVSFYVVRNSKSANDKFLGGFLPQ